MLRDGFLRFCVDPEIACCRAEAELERLRAENVQLRVKLAESMRREQSMLVDMALIAGDAISEKKCYICKYYVDGQGCELDGTQFDDDGECHFTWHGTLAEIDKAVGE
jgi:hypothetical protein